MPNAFTTKLEAVNVILQILDEEPINSLNDELPLEATQALTAIDEINRAIQAQGWHFNTEYEFPLIPNEAGEIILPNSTLECDIDARSGQLNFEHEYIQRGVRLYDRRARTFIIGKELKGTIVSLLEWDDMPEPFRRWVFIKAGRTVYNRVIGDSATDVKLAREEIQAKSTAENFDARTQDTTIFNNGISQGIVNRRMRRRGRFTEYGI